MNKATYYIGIERDIGTGRQLDPVRRATAMQTLRETVSREFGGYTLGHVEGGWVDGRGELIVEGALRLEVYADALEPQFTAFGQRIRELFGQAAVLMDYQDSVRTQLLT